MKELDVPDHVRVADANDMASNHEQANTERAIDAVLSKREKVPEEFDGENCTVCEQPIPDLRLKTGAFRCIHCQERHEAKLKLYRR